MKHKIDRRTANHFWSNHYFWRCQRCGVWVSPDFMVKGGEMNNCGGKKEREMHERIHKRLGLIFPSTILEKKPQ